MAANANLSAKKQGASLAFPTRMMRSRFQSTPEYLSAIADSIGIDKQLFPDDMKDPDVADEIRRSRAFGAIFGFFGTSALVVGRTCCRPHLLSAARIFGRTDFRAHGFSGPYPQGNLAMPDRTGACRRPCCRLWLTPRVPRLPAPARFESSPTAAPERCAKAACIVPATAREPESQSIRPDNPRCSTKASSAAE
jgi:hypothetical protein